jgi:hypothetical protein
MLGTGNKLGFVFKEWRNRAYFYADRNDPLEKKGLLTYKREEEFLEQCSWKSKRNSI